MGLQHWDSFTPDRDDYCRSGELSLSKPRPGGGRGLDASFGVRRSAAAGIAGEVPALTVVDHALVAPPELTRRRMENTGMIDLAETRRAVSIAGVMMSR